MRAPPGLTYCAASVLDADPRLARPLRAHGAGALGRAPLLPLLTVGPGDWSPPEPGALGEHTRALAVLAGLLIHDGSTVLGPGDLIDPWRVPGAWRACTPVRLAVVGAAFDAALERWADVAELATHARPRPLRLRRPAGEASPERLLGLLWQLAARWARPAAVGLLLPAEIDARALPRLLDLPVADVDGALAALQARRAIVRRDDGGWALPQPDRRAARRDLLRARLAQQFAVSRAAMADSWVLGEQVDALRSKRARRRCA